jgi:hypothetical protein
MRNWRRAGSHQPIMSTLKWIWLTALLVLAVIATRLFNGSHLAEEKVIVPKAPVKFALAGFQEPTDASSEVAGKYYGLCRKESIHSVADFQRTVQDDPVLTSYFSGFNWEAAHLGRLDKEIRVIVSYRKDKTIAWTTKQVRLPQGDGYITDGFRFVRTYCCNDYLTDAPLKIPEPSALVPLPPDFASVPPVFGSAPPDLEMPPDLENEPTVSWYHPPEFLPLPPDLLPVPLLPSGGAPGPKPKVRVHIPHVPILPPEFEVVPHKPPRLIPDLVPEPATLVLMGFGAGLILLAGQSRGRRARRGKAGKKE